VSEATGPAEHRPDLALFDFDGTLTLRETFGPFLTGAVPKHRILLGRLLLTPMILAYRAGWVSGVRVRAAVVRIGLSGASAAALRRAGEQFVRDTLPALLRVQMLERLEWHRQRGDTIVIVSGAFDVILDPWCQQLGVERLCSQLESRDGVLGGRYMGEQCVGNEKVRRVLNQYDLSSYTRIHAYGDTAEDHALLTLADEAWFQGQPWTGTVAPAASISA